MKPSESPDVTESLRATNKILRGDLNTNAAKFFLADLDAFKPEDVLWALARCRAELKFFPSVAEVIERIPGAITDETQARAAVARITEALSSIGPYRNDDAKRFIGGLGWEIVKRNGGWQEVCKTAGVDGPLGVFTAQAHKLALAVMEQSRAGTLNIAPDLPAPRDSARLTGFGDMLKSLPGPEEKS